MDRTIHVKFIVVIAEVGTLCTQIVYIFFYILLYSKDGLPSELPRSILGLGTSLHWDLLRSLQVML